MAAIPWAKVKQAFDDMIENEGSLCEFRLRSGEVFSIKGVMRFTAEEQMTDGLSQDRRKLSIMADRWSAQAPPARDPEKGDQVVVDGRRHGIMEADPAVASGQRIGWRLRLTG